MRTPIKKKYENEIEEVKKARKQYREVLFSSFSSALKKEIIEQFGPLEGVSIEITSESQYDDENYTAGFENCYVRNRDDISEDTILEIACDLNYEMGKDVTKAIGEYASFRIVNGKSSVGDTGGNRNAIWEEK